MVSPEGTVFDESAVSLGDEPFPPATRHFLDNFIVDYPGLSAPQNPPLQHDVGLRHVDGDLDHLVIDTLEASSHLLDGDNERTEEKLQQFAHRLVGLLVHTLQHHHNRLVHEFVVEVRNFQIFQAPATNKSFKV